jgi:fatty-acyl-CoA synthase
VPDARVGEEICVWIKLKKNSNLDETTLKNYCKGNISHFKIPRYVKFVDSFPINASQKIMKIKMRQMAMEEYKLSN